MYNFCARYAISPEANHDFEVYDYAVTPLSFGEPPRTDFHPGKNLASVLEKAVKAPRDTESLRYAAASAIQRMDSRVGESAEEWADRLSLTFFTDLENRSS